MRLLKITLATSLGLIVSACEKPLPKASAISHTNIAEELLIDSSTEHGRVGIHFEKIDLKVYAYAMSYTGCEGLDPEVDLTAPYQNTLFGGFKQGYTDVVFVNTTLTTDDMKARGIQAFIHLENPSVVIRYLTESSNLAVTHKAFVTFEGPITVSNQSGTVRQQNLSIQTEGELPRDFLGRCSILAELIVHTATKATKKFVVKNVATSKDMIQMLNSQK